MTGPSAAELPATRARMRAQGVDPSAFSDDQIAALVADMGRRFQDDAPMTAAAAATVILDGVKSGRWRILVGEDAKLLDEPVRAAPETAYDADFRNPFGFTQQRG